MKNRIVKAGMVVGMVLGAVVAGGMGYLQHPKFGAMPQGERLVRIEASPNYRDGVFQNLEPTPLRTDSAGFLARLLGSGRAPAQRLRPEAALPSVKTDLHALDPGRDAVVWLGHSSYFVLAGGKRILIDPVFSASASPVPYTNDAFEGTSAYDVTDMPPIDYLLITHDHWDHLDHPTLVALEPKVRTVVTALGIGAYLEHWGYPAAKLQEADWFETPVDGAALAIHVLPARHYSGRTFTRGKTLWASFAIVTPQRRLYFGGDSGAGAHFADIGRRLGPFDVVALDSGQYDRRWELIHMTPEEAALAAQALGAKALMPAHVGRFQLARHAWDEPFERSAAASAGKPYTLVTPVIGEPVLLDSVARQFPRWWEPSP